MKKKVVMRVLDAVMLLAILLLMAMQVTKQEIHEWLGIGMFALVIAHHILNRKYYAAIFRGKYTPLRVFMLIVNTLLLLSFIATPTTGMLMSRYATPFLNGVVGVVWPRKLHLMLTYWSFVLMGLHAGLHFSIITSKLKNKVVRITAFILMCGIAGYGFWLFIKSNIFDYMIMKTQFAFLDYSKPWWLTLCENLTMLLAWAFAAYLITLVLKKIKKRGIQHEKKVLILSGSPRKGGNSDLLCDEFMRGAIEAGNDVTKIRVAEMKIGYCTGCYYCQKSGGVCAKKDDMPAILQMMIDADVIVLSSPVYFYSIDAQLKTLIDRTVARWTEVKDKEFYYIVTSADEERESQERTIECFRGYADCVEGAKEMGVIYGVGVYQPGEVKNTPAYKEAYKMGRSI